MTGGYELSPLSVLAAESVFVFREAAAVFSRPVLLFSGGKDSAVLLDLAIKAFWPAPPPFPVLHVDTGHNFPEVIEFRDRVVARHGLRLLVGRVEDDLGGAEPVAGRNRLTSRNRLPSRNRLQSATLLRCIREHRFDAVFGGARRDEEKARAKERVFSFRDEFGRWEPRDQRPELWQLYNAAHRPGEHIRIFPLSNWTELDVWRHIRDESLDLPALYYAHRRTVFWRDGMLLAHSAFLAPEPGEEPFDALVRFRTVGDATCTGCIQSGARDAAEVITELSATRISERGATRADDRISDTGMEDRKREGYF